MVKIIQLDHNGKLNHKKELLDALALYNMMGLVEKFNYILDALQ